jgi:hypothetical protein
VDKRVQEDGHKFGIPCVKETLGTHLRPGIWLERLIGVKREMGQTHGKLFKRNLRHAKLCKFEVDFYRMIERIQDTTDLIPPEVDGLRTTRRTTTAHAWNMRLPKDLTDVIHRWGKEMNAKMGIPRLDRQDTYTTLESISPLIGVFVGGVNPKGKREESGFGKGTRSTLLHHGYSARGYIDAVLSRLQDVMLPVA